MRIALFFCAITAMVITVLCALPLKYFSPEDCARNAQGQPLRRGPGAANAQAKSDAYKYLPEGARINDQSKDVVLADLNGDGKQEEIIFFSLPQQHKVGIAVLKPTGMDYTRFWEQLYDDGWGFYELSGVYDLNKSGTPQIIVYRGIGASCPGILEIYEFHNGDIERITGPWADRGKLCGSIEFEDLDGDGRREIIHKQGHGINPDIYRWDGKQYVKRNRQFSQYYNDDLTKLIQDIYRPEAMPASWRVTWCKQALDIYLLQRRYAEAVALCNDVFRIIDDPKLTKPNVIMKEGYTAGQLNSIAAWFEIDKAEGKARIHHLLGDTYKAAGNSQQAQEHYGEAKKLVDQVKDMKSKLPPIKLVPAR